MRKREREGGRAGAAQGAGGAGAMAPADAPAPLSDDKVASPDPCFETPSSFRFQLLLSTVGGQAFALAAPHIWLRRFLFKQSYPDIIY